MPPMILFAMRFSVWIINGILLWLLFACSFISDKVKNTIFPHEISGLKYSKKEISFGKVVSGEEVTDTLFLYNPTERTMEPGFFCTGEWIRVIPEKRYVEPGDTVKVYIRLLSGNCPKYGNCMQRIDFSPERTMSEYHQPLAVFADIAENFTGMTAEEKNMAPRISWDTTEFDFGNVQQEQKVVHVFKINNRGKRDLIIRRVETTCGCTAVIPESRIVKAGDSTGLKVVFHTAGREGKQLKTIRVTCNDFLRPSTILKIRANVESI